MKPPLFDPHEFGVDPTTASTEILLTLNRIYEAGWNRAYANALAVGDLMGYERAIQTLTEARVDK